jgi:hypothetical protein
MAILGFGSGMAITSQADGARTVLPARSIAATAACVKGTDRPQPVPLVPTNRMTAHDATRTRRAFARDCLWLAAIWAALFLPFLTGRRLIDFDSVEAFYPAAFFNAQSLRTGEWPWWNPLIYAGHPQVADPQGLVFSPLLSLLMLLPEHPSVVWFDGCVLVHLLVGGIGMLAFTQRFRLPPAAALLGAMVFVFGGAASARLQHTPIVLAYGFAPWVLLFCTCLVEHASLAGAVGLGLAAGAMLTHPVQATYLLLLVAAGFGATNLARRWQRLRATEALRLLAFVALAAVVALLVAGPQLAATLAFLPLSTRVPFAFDEVAANGLAPRVLATMLWPNVDGVLDGAYTGSGDITESFLYFGTVPLVLVAGFGVAALRRPATRFATGFFAAVAAAGLAYALGGRTPLFGAAFHHLPGVDLFRRPSDAAFVFNLGIAVCAACAAGAALRLADDGRLRRIGIAALGTIATWHVAIGALELLHQRPFVAILAVGAAALVAALLLRRAPGSRYAPALAAALVLLSLADYRVFNVPSRLNAKSADHRRWLEDGDSLVAAIRAEPTAPGALPARIEPIAAGGFWAQGGVFHRLYSTQGYNPMRVRSYDHYFGAAESGNVARRFTAALPTLGAPLFDVAGVRYVVTLATGAVLPAEGGKFEPLVGEAGVTLWRNRSAYPRLLTPSHANVVPPGTLAVAATFADIDFAATVLLFPDTATELPAAAAAAQRCRGLARISAPIYRNNSLAFDVVADAPAWVAVSDVAFPGWQAWAGVEPLPIWRANGPFRAVCVPVGAHRIRMEFSPLAFVRAALATR